MVDLGRNTHTTVHELLTSRKCTRLNAVVSTPPGKHRRSRLSPSRFMLACRRGVGGRVESLTAALTADVIDMTADVLRAEVAC